MAGSRLSNPEDDSTKKRKRDVNEADTRPKRSKAQQGIPSNGHGQAESSADGNLESETNLQSGGLLNQKGSGVEDIVSRSHDGETGWRISKPMGGRMLDIDPILTRDDQRSTILIRFRYLILTYNTSVQVYTASDSLLLRRIPIGAVDTPASKGTSPATIVATKLSLQNPEYVWVACSDGHIYHVKWTETNEAHRSFQTVTGTAKAITVTVASTDVPGAVADIVVVAESNKSNWMELTAYGGDILSSPLSKSILTVKKPDDGLHLIESSQDGLVLVGAFNDSLFLGVASQEQSTGFEKLHYDFFSFDVPDLVTTLDFRVYPASALSGNRGKGRRDSDKIVDVIVGGARGAIYLYHDALSRSQSLGKSNPPKEGIQAQKFHWHRKAVHAVKWSRDGNYMISGGSENVLVMWQMDTVRKDFLPHLSGSIENIVVSASGSSYVVHLDDNSTMVLSTAEMKPTTYVSGIQSAAVETATPKDLLVRRVWSVANKVRRPIPAAIKATEPSKLHVCVGNGRQATMTGDFSAPLLQSFDLETFMSVSKQALARTQPTDANLTNKGYAIEEPLVTHIAFSADGKWLASVDDWVPSNRDVGTASGDIGDQFLEERHESYLKFWQVNGEDNSIALVSRINAPHATSHPETVLDLASDAASTCFATIAGDGVVRLWRPKTRQQEGSRSSDRNADFTWVCSRLIPIGDGLGRDAIVDIPNDASGAVKAQGRIAFSEDGSTLFAAFGALDVGAVYVINAASGEVVKILEGLWKGRLHSLRVLSQYLIVLSEELHVYDVVGDDLRYGIIVPKVSKSDELLQLAVDSVSGHFAVTLPLGNTSSIGVFHPSEPEPLIVRSTPHRVVSLVSVPGTSGFVALDDVAQIWTITEGSNTSTILAAQPLQDLRLDSASQEADDSKQAIVFKGDAESDDEMEEARNADEDVEMEDNDEVQTNVIPQQYLADIFDAAPAFAGASIEDMFYKVTGLLATKPLSAATV
ncbi:u3 small nucleolar rna-associated 17 [Trichoderma cornu-damae]|uniref:U3 small nucleolar rna-associated 17 n=1 Tax=Trichoderma cornu-damae TaxID=654480 RepID=A0A9P8QN30_9HYPO|nr:u3 small nucleolar rna-associated 17 [Trichoderma cornu-damae]